MKKYIAGGIATLALLSSCALPFQTPVETSAPQPTVTVTQTVTPSPEPTYSETPEATPTPTKEPSQSDKIEDAFTKGGYECDWKTTPVDGPYDGALHSCAKYKIIFAILKDSDGAQELAGNLDAEAPESLQGWYMVVIKNVVFLFHDEKFAEDFAKGAEVQAVQI